MATAAAAWPTPSDATCDSLQSLAWQHRSLAPRRAPVHELVLKSAAHRDKSGFIVREGRLGSWANTTRIFHMTHIAKTGGRSVRVELMRLVRPVGGAEQCYPPFAHESRINVIFFREPRGHALSQYLHGAYAGRTKLRRDAGYPVVDGDDLAGFDKWVRHFGEGWTADKGDFFGYNPLNMMARTLTCRDARWNCDYVRTCDVPCAHHVGQTSSDAFPPIAESVAAVHAADFVGVLELLPESLCLAEYRKTGRLAEHCMCTDPAAPAAGGAAGAGGAGAAGGGAAAAGGAERRVAHVMNSKRQRAKGPKVSVRDAPAATLRALDEITSVDARVYMAAFLRVLCDLRALERATGRRVLCAGSRAASVRNKTAYMHTLWDGTAAARAVDEWADARQSWAAKASAAAGGGGGGGGGGGSGGGGGGGGSGGPVPSRASTQAAPASATVSAVPTAAAQEAAAGVEQKENTLPRRLARKLRRWG